MLLSGARPSHMLLSPPGEPPKAHLPGPIHASYSFFSSQLTRLFSQARLDLLPSLLYALRGLCVLLSEHLSLFKTGIFISWAFDYLLTSSLDRHGLGLLFFLPLYFEHLLSAWPKGGTPYLLYESDCMEMNKSTPEWMVGQDLNIILCPHSIASHPLS